MCNSVWSGAGRGVTYCLGNKNKIWGVDMGKIHHLPLFAVLLLSACGAAREGMDNSAELASIEAIDDATVADIMLNAGDAQQAIAFFRGKLADEPNRVDYKRGLAQSYIRARQYADAVLIYEQMDAAGQANNDDLMALADAYLRNGGWDEARATLAKVPPTLETYDRYRLEALLADNNQEWDRADSFYETARGLTTTPASILNNWGFSKRVRGEYEAAERLFRQALSYDSDLFTAKTNLAVVRALQGNYRLPIIPMTDVEKAVLLYEVARIAANRGDRDIARGMLEQAIDTHPQFFDAAVQALATLNSAGPNE